MNDNNCEKRAIFAVKMGLIISHIFKIDERIKVPRGENNK